MTNSRCFKKIENNEKLMTITGGAGTCASTYNGTQLYWRTDGVGYYSIYSFSNEMTGGRTVVCWGDGIADMLSVL